MSPLKEDKASPGSDAEQIRILAAKFEDCWEPEAWERMLELSQQAPPHLLSNLIEELIAIDVRKRLSEKMTLLDPNSYIRRFPELAAQPQWQGGDRNNMDRSAAIICSLSQTVPDKIGRYKVISALASGGEANVYLCSHPEWRTQVVVKWMRKKAVIYAEWRELFTRQGELLNRLKHPNIVQVHDQGECEGRPFIVTEYFQGRTLERYFQDVRPGPKQSVAVISQIAGALEQAHKIGIYHQDVKPANILINEMGEAKLIDFGLAWFRPAWSGGNDPHGYIAGTPGYLSPEQANDGVITARTDVFALGAVLYFLLTGESLYPDPKIDVVLDRAIKCNWNASLLDQPGIPTRLQAVCRTALNAEPQQRHASAKALADAAVNAIRVPWYRSSQLLGKVALLLLIFVSVIVAGRSLQRWWFPSLASSPLVKANLSVQVHRQGFDPKPLSEVVPLRNGDRLQIRFRIPVGVHLSLVSVNGEGRLRILQTYESRESTHEVIWPGSGNGIELVPPQGTEFLLVCGRTDRQPTENELQEAWDAGKTWPSLEPKEQLLRIRPEEITSEGTTSRDFGKVVDFPEFDQVKQRLEQFRERLVGFPVLDGVAFRHQ